MDSTTAGSGNVHDPSVIVESELISVLGSIARPIRSLVFIVVGVIAIWKTPEFSIHQNKSPADRGYAEHTTELPQIHPGRREDDSTRK
jgi:hypothetical protein